MMRGQKAENLFKMKQAGINVPDFVLFPFEKICNNADVSRLDIFTELPDEAGCKYAVRSSASAEDGSEFSFAGQFKTYLNVVRADIPEKIHLCVNAVSDKGAAVYAEQNGISLSELKMDVIVQKMVNADISGVMFTSNPQGLLNETVITVGRGLGEGVVSERVDTTTYYYSTTDKLYYYEGREDLLRDHLAVLGDYLDIEFAVENEIIYILQARKITTLDGSEPLILDNSNIVESYPGVSLPLTISFVHLVYSGVFRGVCRRIVKNEKVLDQKSDVYNNMVGDANGRMYYKISNWYTVLKFLPFHKKIIPIWQEMLGVKTKSFSDDDVSVPFHVRIMSYVNFAGQLIFVPRSMKKLERIFRQVNDGFYDAFSDDMMPEELHALFEDIRKKLFGVWDVTLINDMYAFIFTGLLKNRLKKLGRTDDMINAYISGISDIESIKPMKMMIDIAYHKKELTTQQYEERKAEYIKLFGDRAPEELKLESKTFRSTPSLFDERVDCYCADPGRLKQLYEELGSHGEGEVRREDIYTAFLRKKAALGIKNREISRLNRSRAYGIVRTIFTAVGRQLEKDGFLENAEDVFYLTIDEAFLPPENAAKLTSQRKERYRLYRNLPAYTRLIFDKHEFNKNHAGVNAYSRRRESNKLVGTPCSFGKATGRACVITDAARALDVRGKILVTKMTDPGWVFLIAGAKGIVSEKGSLLSHTAIISRELKIPSIVGTDGLLETVKDGDLLHMNGSTGEIEIIREELQ